MRRSALALAAGLLTTAAALSGCAADGAADSGSTAAGGSTASASASASGSITVLAAASLTESFTTLGKQFESDHPGSKVTFSFAASSKLAEQITSGAEADVFASASTKTMQEVVDSGDASDPTDFAANVMQIAVPPDNPGKVTGLDSLTSSSVKTALCQPQVPCGATAQKVFDNAKITVKPVTLEPDVKSVLSKVELDVVDVGVVYVTDVKSAGDKVKGVQIPDDVNASTTYPIAVLKASPDEATAQAFVDLVLSADGQQVLKAAGFQTP